MAAGGCEPASLPHPRVLTGLWGAPATAVVVLFARPVHLTCHTVTRARLFTALFLDSPVDW